MRLPCFEIGSISAHGSLFVTRHAQYGFLAWRRTRSGWRQRAAGRGAAYALLSRIILTVAIFLISAAGFPSLLLRDLRSERKRSSSTSRLVCGILII